jgi:hypothetical protein
MVPLAADDETTANVPDNQMRVSLASSSSLVFSLPSSSSLVFSLPSLRYVAAAPGSEDKILYEHSKGILGIDLVCPVEKHKSTFKKRLELLHVFINLQSDSLSIIVEEYI